MAKKKSSQGNGILYILLTTVITIIVSILFMLFEAISIYTTGYKKKSGNGFFKTYFNKGNYGEFKLYRKAIKIFGKENVFTNIYLENQNTELTEIDVLAISDKGIYVFEMKNYGGYIYGSLHDEYWTQAFHKNSKHKFYNPIKQNYAHTKAVEKYLDIPTDKIIPVIVFSNRSKLTKVYVDFKTSIIQLKELAKFVRKNQKNKENIIDKDMQKEYILKLIEKSNMSEEVKEKHIEQIIALKEIKSK